MDCFDKIIGYESIKNELRRICDTLKNPEKYKELGVYTPRGLLIEGKIGLGKTKMVNCLIEESGRKTFILRKDKSDGDFIDFIKKTFEDAKQNQPSIVFLDDVDKFANDDENHLNSEEFVTIQSCIDEMKDSEVFVVATANDTRRFPESMIRIGRFDYDIEVEAPNQEDAKKIIDYYVSQKKCKIKFDLDLVSRILDGHSCAELETVINEAGIYAGYENRDYIDMDDFVKASMRILFKAPESSAEQKPYILRKKAVHEAGHAVVKEILEPNSVNIVSINVYQSDVGGITSAMRPEEYWYSYEMMENNVLTLLGGMAATEIVYGETDTGVDRDLDRTFRIVKRMIENYCIAGFNYYEAFFNDKTKEDLNENSVIAEEVNRLYRKAKKILVDNRQFLDDLTEKIIEKRVVLAPEIQQIRNSIKK